MLVFARARVCVFVCVCVCVCVCVLRDPLECVRSIAAQRQQTTNPVGTHKCCVFFRRQVPPSHCYVRARTTLTSDELRHQALNLAISVNAADVTLKSDSADVQLPSAQSRRSCVIATSSQNAMIVLLCQNYSACEQRTKIFMKIH